MFFIALFIIDNNIYYSNILFLIGWEFVSLPKANWCNPKPWWQYNNPLSANNPIWRMAEFSGCEICVFHLRYISVYNHLLHSLQYQATFFCVDNVRRIFILNESKLIGCTKRNIALLWIFENRSCFGGIKRLSYWLTISWNPFRELLKKCFGCVVWNLWNS